ncbi:MAG: MarR family transcriptional regulator [Actinobacteria bacterium]|nr:MarR family transcriptional regulator [Actinomycetota bacterium]MBU4403781.1 MarR family transcriptional regulator [Actinomycetota bacterium]MCG2819293.1 MarR family transcriptional regulator [Actinomycetes bacterium]
MATPNEIEILRIIQEHGNAHNRQVGGAMGISASYAEFLLATMATRGWVRREKGVGYVFTPAGVDVLIYEFMYSREKLAMRAEWMEKQIELIDREVEKLEFMKEEIPRKGVKESGKG